MAWAEEAREHEALQSANKAVAKAKALPDAWDDISISIKGRPKAEQIIRQSLSEQYYAKFKLLAKLFYACYGKSLYKLSYSNLFHWHLIADDWPISNLLNMPITDAMLIIHNSYAEYCLIRAERFKASTALWLGEDRQEHTLYNRIRQWHCKHL